jgi:hypothetical protein
MTLPRWGLTVPGAGFFSNKQGNHGSSTLPAVYTVYDHRISGCASSDEEAPALPGARVHRFVDERLRRYVVVACERLTP